jgi:urease accessory protein
MNKKMIIALIGLSLPSIAFAHPGHSDGFISAFAHPFTGIDHLLMMLCVGVLAGRIGGGMRWQLPLAFLGAMTAGWVLGANGFIIAGIDSGIAAGLIALGVMFIAKITPSRSIQIIIIAAFASLHGMAHGVELNGTTSLLIPLAFLAATALLHGAGLLIAEMMPPRERQNAYRALGTLLAVVGGGLLAGI